MELSNKTKGLVEMSVVRLAGLIKENGQEANTELAQVFAKLTNVVLQELTIFYSMFDESKVVGEGTEKLSFSVRGAWSETRPEEDYDYLGLALAEILSEQLSFTGSEETKIQWDEWDESDTLIGNITNAFRKTLLQEYPASYDDKAFYFLHSLIENGKKAPQTAVDNGYPEVAPINKISYEDFTDPTLTNEEKTAIAQKIKESIFDFNTNTARLDNPIVKGMSADNMPKFNIISRELLKLFQETIWKNNIFTPDKSFNSMNFNIPIEEYVIDGIRMIVHPKLVDYDIIIFTGKQLYKNTPTFKSRVDFIASSVSKKFMKVVAKGLDFDASYWRLLYGNSMVGQREGKITFKARFINYSRGTGTNNTSNVDLKVDGLLPIDTTKTYTARLYTTAGSVIAETAIVFDPLTGIVDQTINIENLSASFIYAEIVDDEDQKVVARTENYLISSLETLPSGRMRTLTSRDITDNPSMFKNSKGNLHTKILMRTEGFETSFIKGIPVNTNAIDLKEIRNRDDKMVALKEIKEVIRKKAVKTNGRPKISEEEKKAKEDAKKAKKEEKQRQKEAEAQKLQEKEVKNNIDVIGKEINEVDFDEEVADVEEKN